MVNVQDKNVQKYVHVHLEQQRQAMNVKFIKKKYVLVVEKIIDTTMRQKHVLHVRVVKL